MSNVQLSAESCLQLASVYDLLSTFWSKELSISQLQKLCEPELRNAVEKLGGVVPDKATDDVVEALAVEYCRLFIGPKNHLPPVESVWAGGQFQTSTVASVQRFYEMLSGFRPRVNIADHLGAQLEFMGQLFQQAGMQENSDAYTDVAQQFFNKHLTWTEPFLDRVIESAELDFYRGLANVTKLFLNENFVNEEES